MHNDDFDLCIECMLKRVGALLNGFFSERQD